MPVATSPVQCFLLLPTTDVMVFLRRYRGSEHGQCKASGYGYHNTQAELGVFPGKFAASDREVPLLEPFSDKVSREDPRWPRKCACGFEFSDQDYWQHFQLLLYVRQDTGERITWRDAPPGAMYYADWLLTPGSSRNRGPDGHALVVKCPDGHEWHVDGRASNCTRPDDDEHRCWVRHGVPPRVTVDKSGNTCEAGAGSILTPYWHGYLRDGQLVV